MVTELKRNVSSRRQILGAIKARWQLHGFAPTVREIAADVGMSTTRLWGMLSELRAQGFIEYQDRAPRTLRLSEHTFTQTANRSAQ